MSLVNIPFTCDGFYFDSTFDTEFLQSFDYENWFHYGIPLFKIEGWFDRLSSSDQYNISINWIGDRFLYISCNCTEQQVSLVQSITLFKLLINLVGKYCFNMNQELPFYCISC